MSEKYEEIKKIGEGAFGQVFLVKEKATGKILVKKLTEETIKYEKYVKGERELNEKLRSIQPMYINYSLEEFQEKKKIEVKATAKVTERTYSALILPYCDLGDLEKHVATNKFLSENETRKFSYQILTAIKYCHDNDIIHRDLKLQNVLLNNENGEVISYLCDFGLSKQTIDSANTVLGTYAFMAPELFQTLVKKSKGVAYDKKVDAWSFGMMVYRMLTGILPFDSMNDFETFLQAKSVKVPFGRNLSLCALSFLEFCFQIDPVKRGSIDQLLQHEFITACPIPWYYYNKITSGSMSVVISSTAMKFTGMMNARKAEVEEKMKSDVYLYSLCEQCALG